MLARKVVFSESLNVSGINRNLLGLAVFLGANIIPGVQVDSYWTAVLAAVLISLANATIGTILRIFTFPINFLTLGLVSFIITVLMILLVDNMMTSFNTS